MKMSSHEIKSKMFRTKLRGFDPAEVTGYLGTISEGWDDLAGENEDLRNKIIELETKLRDYVSMEKAIQQTFMQAQETSGRATENARKEAQLLIQDAEGKATQLLGRARSDLTSLKEEVTILKAKKDSLIARLKMLLTSELNLISALEVDEELRARDVAEGQPGFSKNKSEIEDIIKSIE